jgi:energy-converting hydrogenase Eha subunit B
MDDSPALLSRLANSAIAGLKLLAVGLAALVMALVAAVTTIVGVAAKVVAEVLAQVAGLMREALPFLLSIVPVLARAGLVLGACASMVAAFPYLWDEYAGDTGSVLVGGMVAAGLVLVPVALAALSGKWAALLGAITGTWAVWGLAHLGAGARTFVILAPLAVMTVREIFDGRIREHGYEEVSSTDGNPPY